MTPEEFTNEAKVPPRRQPGWEDENHVPEEEFNYILDVVPGDDPVTIDAENMVPALEAEGFTYNPDESTLGVRYRLYPPASEVFTYSCALRTEGGLIVPVVSY